MLSCGLHCPLTQHVFFSCYFSRGRHMHVVPRFGQARVAIKRIPPKRPNAVAAPIHHPPILSPDLPRVPLVAIFHAVSIYSCSAVPRLINVPTDLYQAVVADGSVQIHTRAVDASILPTFEKRSESEDDQQTTRCSGCLPSRIVLLDTLDSWVLNHLLCSLGFRVQFCVLTTNTADTNTVLHFRDLEHRTPPVRPTKPTPTMAMPRPGDNFQGEQVFWSPSGPAPAFYYPHNEPSSCRSSQNFSNSPPVQPFADAQFDIFEWHPYFQSCLRYFLDHAQYEGPIQALAAFVNIQLPFQRSTNPVLSSRANSPSGGGPGLAAGFGAQGSSGRAAGVGPGMAGPGGAGLLGGFPSHISLLPYIRRLVATGFDFPAVLHGFFGDDWQRGIGQFHEQERRNYLFATKSNSWLDVKAAYDMGAEETIPFLKPLQNTTEKEIQAAEAAWSEWLAMQDW